MKLLFAKRKTILPPNITKTTLKTKSLHLVAKTQDTPNPKPSKHTYKGTK